MTMRQLSRRAFLKTTVAGAAVAGVPLPLRAQPKTFKIGEHQSIEGSFDAFNTLNSNAVLTQVNTNGPDYLKVLPQPSSAALALAILPPRVFRLGARWTF